MLVSTGRALLIIQKSSTTRSLPRGKRVLFFSRLRSVPIRTSRGKPGQDQRGHDRGVLEGHLGKRAGKKNKACGSARSGCGSRAGGTYGKKGQKSEKGISDLGIIPKRGDSRIQVSEKLAGRHHVTVVEGSFGLSKGPVLKRPDSVAFHGSQRSETLTVSLYNCDATGGGNDVFLGQAVIDLYAALPYESFAGSAASSEPSTSQARGEMLGYRDRVYDDWIALEGGEAPNATLRVQLAVVHEMISGQKSDGQLSYTLEAEQEDLGTEVDQHLHGYADQEEEALNGTGLLGDEDESPFQMTAQNGTYEDNEAAGEMKGGAASDGDWDEYPEGGREEGEISYEEEDGEPGDEAADWSYGSHDREDETANVGVGEEGGALATRRREFLSVTPSASQISAATQRSSVSDARRHTVRARRPSILLSREDQPVHAKMTLRQGLETQFKTPTRLRLTLKEARDLMARKPVLAHRIGPFPTVYCYIGWHNDEGIPSTAIERTLNPVWGEDEVFDLELQPSDFDKPVPIFIRDYDIEEEEDVGCLGVAHLDLCKIPLGNPSTWTLRIRKGRGELRVRCELEGNKAEIRQTVHRVKGLKPAASTESMTGTMVSVPGSVEAYKKKEAGPSNEKMLKKLVGSDDNSSDDMRRASLVSLDGHIAVGSRSVSSGEEDEVFDLRGGSFESSEDGATGSNKREAGRKSAEQSLRRVESRIRETPIAVRHRASFITGLSVLDMEGVAQEQKGEAPTPGGKRRPSRSVVPDTAQDAVEFSRFGHEEETDHPVSHGRSALLGEPLSGSELPTTSSRAPQEDVNLWDDEDPEDVTRRRVLLKAPTADFGVRGTRRIVGVAGAAGAAQGGRRIDDNNYFAAGPDADAQADGELETGPVGLGQRRGSAEGDAIGDEEEVEAIGTAIDASGGGHHVSWEPGSGGFAWEAEEPEDATAEPFLLRGQSGQVSGTSSDNAEDDEDERFFGTATETRDEREEKPAFWRDDSASSVEQAENLNVPSRQGWIDASGETEEVTEEPSLYGKGREAEIKEARLSSTASQSRVNVAKEPDFKAKSGTIVSGDDFERKKIRTVKAVEGEDLVDELGEHLSRGELDTTRKLNTASRSIGETASQVGRCRFLVVASAYEELEMSLQLDTERVADRLGKGVELLQKEYGLSEESQDTTKVYLSQSLINYFGDLADGSASTSNVLQGLRWLAESSRSGDTAVFHFTGRKGLVSRQEFNANSLLVTESGDEVTQKQFESCFKRWIPRHCKVYCLFDYLLAENHGHKGSHRQAFAWDAKRMQLVPAEVTVGARKEEDHNKPKERISITSKNLAAPRTSLTHSDPATFSFAKEEPSNGASTSSWKREKKQEHAGSRRLHQAGVAFGGAAAGTRPQQESVERSSMPATSEGHVSGTSVYEKRGHESWRTTSHPPDSGNGNKMHDADESRKDHARRLKTGQRFAESEEVGSSSRGYTKEKPLHEEQLRVREIERAMPSQLSGRTNSPSRAVASHKKTLSNAAYIPTRSEDNTVLEESDSRYEQRATPHDQRGQAFDMSRQRMLARQGLPPRRFDRKETDASYRPDEAHGSAGGRVPQVPSSSVIGMPGPYVMPHGVPVSAEHSVVAAAPAPHTSSGPPVAPHHHHVVTVVHHGRPAAVPQPVALYNNGPPVNIALNGIRPMGQPAHHHHHHHHVIVRKTAVTSPAPNSNGSAQGRQYFHLPAPSSY